VQPDELGAGLRVIVSLAVGLILFEGGLTLEIEGYRSAPTMIKRLLTIGVLTTWLGGALVIMLVLDVAPRNALLAASLVIVTGPTVVAPLLRRIQVAPRLHGILHWEGVLIDPLGVFIALLCFEYVVSGESGLGVLGNLGARLAAGIGYGVAGGALITWLLRRKIVPEDMVNVFALAGAVLIFGLGEWTRPEAGLLSTTVAGFVFGLTGPVHVKQVRQFKADITDLLIGTLFILLSARLTLDQFADFGARGVLIVAIMMLVVRPVSVALCSWGLDLSLRERAFLAWVAPRGIVAASMASLISISMAARPGAATDAGRLVESFTYSVIVATIVFQGLTAGPLARVLGLKRPEPVGWLIVGAHAVSRRLAWFLARAAQVPVLLVDTNTRAVREARAEKLAALAADARDVALQERPEFQGVGRVLALTDNEDLNVRLCQIWGEVLGPDRVFRGNPTGAEPVRGDGADARAAGRVVWPRCPKPSILSGEIQRREARLVEVEGRRRDLESSGIPLAAVIDGRLVIDPREALEQAGEASVIRGLYLERRADYLGRAVRPELVTTITAGSVPEMLRRMVDLVSALAPKLPAEEIHEELREREAAFPTALGHGVAVPHAFSSVITERLCAIARLPEGLDVGAADGEPVRLVFLLISPAGDPEGHLATLAEIARLVFDEHVRTRLIEAPSPTEVVRIVRGT
jgi:NhaP-type Na+/H+ or K+/H+ antiporter/mannitol/fructose-specific phosphotransferase system IIA component (Ntr-type)